MSDGVSVRGGVGALDAQYEDMQLVAGLFRDVVRELAGAVWSMNAYRHGNDLEMMLDAPGRLVFEARLDEALSELSRIAKQCDMFDRYVHSAVDVYRSSDHSIAHFFTKKMHTLVHLPGALAAGEFAFLRSNPLHHPLKALDEFGTTVFEHDPGIADDLVRVASGFRPFGMTLALIAADGGRAILRDKGIDPASETRTPPRSVRDILTGIARRSHAQHGEIDIKFLRRPDGTRAVIVDLSGTKSWNPIPSHDVTALATNARALRGQRTAYEDGVLTAMRRAGVTSSDAVMLAGYSEGGMVAVNLANRLTRSGEYSVTHIVTAGAPIGLTAGKLPDSVRVLAIESDHDLVPHLDAADNPDRSTVTTVTTHRDAGGIIANHDVDETYLPAAADVDASGNASIRAFLDSAGGFLDASSVETHRYVITRTL